MYRTHGAVNFLVRNDALSRYIVTNVNIIRVECNVNS